MGLLAQIEGVFLTLGRGIAASAGRSPAPKSRRTGARGLVMTGGPEHGHAPHGTRTGLESSGGTAPVTGAGHPRSTFVGPGGHLPAQWRTGASPGGPQIRAPQFTDLGGPAAGEQAQSKEISGTISQVANLIPISGAGKIGTVIGNVLGSALATGNAAGLSPQQMAFVDKQVAAGLPVGQVLAAAEGRDGSKVIVVGGEDVRIGGQSGTGGAADAARGAGTAVTGGAPRGSALAANTED